MLGVEAVTHRILGWRNTKVNIGRMQRRFSNLSNIHREGCDTVNTRNPSDVINLLTPRALMSQHQLDAALRSQLVFLNQRTA